MEVNPRIQVEHTVTEEIFDLDLVELQLRVARGESIADLSIEAESRGSAVQLRVNAEYFGSDGQPRLSGGTITRHELPQGRGIARKVRHIWGGAQIRDTIHCCPKLLLVTSKKPLDSC